MRLQQKASRRKIDSYYPDDGPLRRELYPKHMKFFAAGAIHRERAFIAANRIGKTEGAGGYETALHLTGQYPDWWEGKRFEHPISAWMAGKTNETTRDILQAKMFGRTEWVGRSKGLSGTGLVPYDTIGQIAWKRGSDLIDTVDVKHVSGGYSTLGAKSYEQGRGSFEGTEQHLIWLDEEPSLAIYAECLIRTMTTQGIILATFTPLEGMSETVLQFLPGGRLPEEDA